MKPIYMYLYIYIQWIGWKCSEYPSSCGNPLKYDTPATPPPLAGWRETLKIKKKKWGRGEKEGEEGEEKGGSWLLPLAVQQQTVFKY